MGIIRIKKGLDLPISGSPNQKITKTLRTKKVALLGDDYVGMKPTMLVAIGDFVKLGQVLFTDKKAPGVKYTSPASGKVIELNRGEKRAFKSIVIEVDGTEGETFKSYSENEIENISSEEIKSNLIESGLWTSFRERPFSKVANPGTDPSSIFITAMDTNPLAPSIEKILEGNETNFKIGLKLICKLTKNSIFLCKLPGSTIPTVSENNLLIGEFDGPHPSGLVGTHIHYLDPVSSKKHVWYIGVQDVAAIGYLFSKGKINTERIISLAGPQVKDPTLLKTQIGTDLTELTNGELKEGENRIISGSVISGFTASGMVPYLGRYHQQVSVIEEDRKREFFGWVNPSASKYSIMSVLLSSILPNKKFNFNTSLNGGHRAIVPVGSYEKVMPLDITINYLLRSLAVDDIEEAEQLGCYELDEEDLALCTFVCPSKIDHGENLRRNLTIIEKEG